MVKWTDSPLIGGHVTIAVLTPLEIFGQVLLALPGRPAEVTGKEEQ